jgi:hypothetical protein
MGYFFLDDSNHPAAGFCLGAFVFSVTDPQKELEQLLGKNGLTPGIDEFKSSIRMDSNSPNFFLRDDLKNFLRQCKVGVAISRTSAELYEASASLLEKMLRHPDISANEHQVFIDRGIFPTRQERVLLDSIEGSSTCRFHFEQDSKEIYGIQLADLAAHTCAIMMKDSLGLVTKMVKAGENSGHDPDSDMELGFEMYATLRYSFLGEFAPYDETGSSLQPMLILDKHGLVISQKLEETIQKAAKGRFSSLYLGCIH